MVLSHMTLSDMFDNIDYYKDKEQYYHNLCMLHLIQHMLHMDLCNLSKLIKFYEIELLEHTLGEDSYVFEGQDGKQLLL